MAFPVLFRTLRAGLLALTAAAVVPAPAAAGPESAGAPAERGPESVSGAGVPLFEGETAPLRDQAAVPRKPSGAEDEPPPPPGTRAAGLPRPEGAAPQAAADRDRPAAVRAFLVPYKTGPPRA